MDTTSDLGAPSLSGDQRADVVIVGAGITGLTAAALLGAEGVGVVVLEAGTVGGGVTGHTTAKVTALHGLVYDELRSKFGPQGARVYAEANRAALERIAAFVADEKIECGWRRRTAYTYVRSSARRPQIEDEVSAAREAGLPTRLVAKTPLPFPVAAAVALDDQAELHARAYLLGLAGLVQRNGGQIFEHSPVLGASWRGRPSVRTAEGSVQAGHVVVATLMPMLDRGLFFSRLTAKRSYCLSMTVRGTPPEGMFISAEEPTRSVRSQAPVPGGPDEELLIVGGEGHTTGEETATGERYRRLEHFAREHFDVRRITHRWSAHDLMPADGLPYVGPITPLGSRILTAAGYRKWGLTNGTAAAMILTDRILGRENPWAARLDSNRLTPRRSARGVAAEVAKDARHLIGDRFKRSGTVEDLAPGQGGLVRIEGKLAAAYREPGGRLHAVSCVCTHLGCRVAFNEAERSWDCPCHGSRFAVDGTVLQGPAVQPLAQRLPSDA
jgi:glycine/D-amino acid oxidase-like deaminating enzyme/nitrite reductase/ring-hydroxylating ferredoxin subunit